MFCWTQLLLRYTNIFWEQTIKQNSLFFFIIIIIIIINVTFHWGCFFFHPWISNRSIYDVFSTEVLLKAAEDFQAAAKTYQKCLNTVDKTK